MFTIHTVDALAGSGKTYSAIKWAIQEAYKGGNICIVQPSIALINQTYLNLKSEIERDDRTGILYLKKITSETESGSKSSSVVSQIDKYLRNPFPENNILLITHASFLRLKFFSHSINWTTILDEIPNPFEFGRIEGKKTFDKFLPELELTEYNQVLSKLSFKKNKHNILRNCQNDDTLKPYSTLSDYLQSQTYDVLVKTGEYNKLCDKNNHNSLSFICVFKLHNLQQFKKVIAMGAFFDDSFFNLLARYHNKNKPNSIIFKEHLGIMSGLRIKSKIHENLGKLVLFHAYNRNWTKTFFRQNNPETGLRYIDEIFQSVQNEFKNEPYIYLINNDEKALVKNLNPSLLVSGSPHGLNQYQEIDRAAFLSANNPSPQFFSLLKAFGISSQEIKTQIQFIPFYQFLMRTSLRNIDSESVKYGIVPSLEIAEFAKLKFKNVELRQLNGVGYYCDSLKKGRKKLVSSKSSTKRSQDCRRLNNINEFKNLNLEYCNVNTYKDYIDKNVAKFDMESVITFQIYLNTKSLNDPEFNHKDSIRNMLDDWKKYTELPLANKDDHPLVSTAKFKGESRKLSDVLYIFGIFLDFDGGDFSKEDLMKLFPNNQIFIYNTFKAAKNRFRAFLPTDQLLTAWAYKDVCKTIFKLIEDIGFEMNPKSKTNKKKVCFLDRTKFSANSIFYLPRKCSNESKKFNFIIEQNGSFLNVDYLLHYPMHEDDNDFTNMNMFNQSINETIEINEDIEIKIQNLIAQYQQIPKGAGERNAGFFQLGIGLLKLNLNAGQIANNLQKADYDNSRGMKGIDSCLNSLNKIRIG